MIYILLGILVLMIVAVLLFLRKKKVAVTKKTDKDLSEYTSFAFLPGDSINLPSRPGKELQEVSEPIIRAVHDNMKRAGYILDRNNPDLLVMIRVVEETPPPAYATFPYSAPLPVNPFYAPYAYAGYAQMNAIHNYAGLPTEKVKGSLSVLVIERRGKKILWEGKATDSFYDRNAVPELVSYIDLIFEEYPTEREERRLAYQG
ncbi:DUF4136 domain-containing protein [Maribacter sp. 2307ULW6-5]|uniref:DUF4136 domain-containing protein n=1 Tax=Maribacter sp. 2307ULW6-5 TaxID=3386275 RepID=UPI0039BD3EF7